MHLKLLSELAMSLQGCYHHLWQIMRCPRNWKTEYRAPSWTRVRRTVRECSQSASVQSSGKSWSQPSWKLFLGTWRRCLGIVSVDLPRGNGAWLTWLPFVVRWLDQGMRGEQKMSPALTLAILLICSATWKTESSVVRDAGWGFILHLDAAYKWRSSESVLFSYLYWWPR